MTELADTSCVRLYHIQSLDTDSSRVFPSDDQNSLLDGIERDEVGTYFSDERFETLDGVMAAYLFAHHRDHIPETTERDLRKRFVEGNGRFLNAIPEAEYDRRNFDVWYDQKRSEVADGRNPLEVGALVVSNVDGRIVRTLGVVIKAVEVPVDTYLSVLADDTKPEPLDVRLANLS